MPNVEGQALNLKFPQLGNVLKAWLLSAAPKIKNNQKTKILLPAQTDVLAHCKSSEHLGDLINI